MNDEEAVDSAVTLYMEQNGDPDSKVDDKDFKNFLKSISALILFPIGILGKIVYFIRRKLGLQPIDPLQLWGRIQSTTQSIRLMQEFEVYKASAVYVTFETEQAQRFGK